MPLTAQRLPLSDQHALGIAQVVVQGLALLQDRLHRLLLLFRSLRLVALASHRGLFDQLNLALRQRLPLVLQFDV